MVKGTVMQIKKALINDRLPFQFSIFLKIAYFITDSIVFSDYKQNVTTQLLKNLNKNICCLC